MEKRICSLSNIDSIETEFYLLNYYNESSCGECLAHNIANEQKMQKMGINNLYIINVHKNELTRTYRNLCSKRVEGTVYLDTCNAFLSANPQIPDNELYHTFVINKEGKVLMVGNPFQNEKMEELFKKVIAKERKGQKKNTNKAA